jgi:hypothetical protein
MQPNKSEAGCGGAEKKSQAVALQSTAAQESFSLSMTRARIRIKKKARANKWGSHLKDRLGS